MAEASLSLRGEACSSSSAPPHGSGTIIGFIAIRSARLLVACGPVAPRGPRVRAEAREPVRLLAAGVPVVPRGFGMEASLRLSQSILPQALSRAVSRQEATSAVNRKVSPPRPE